MTPRTAAITATTTTLAIVCACLLLWHPWSPSLSRSSSQSSSGTDASALTSADSPSPGGASQAATEREPTTIYAHNLRLLKGPDFRVYVRWIRGQLQRTHRAINPSLDDPDSFVLNIQKGVIHANIGDIGDYLNTSLPDGAPLRKVSIQPDGNRLKIRGTLHKLVALPIELTGTVSPTAEGLVRFHAEHVNVLKIPLKGLLGGLHIELSDLVHDTHVAGVTITDNDIVFDTQKVLPPPHIHGQITSINVKPPDLEVIYGNAPNDEARLAQWHNFLRLNGGSLDFGKLTMNHVDLTMIDASQDPWFDLDLVNYQAQLVNGYTRMTAQAGLEIFMPDIDEKNPKKPPKDISVEWLRDRNRSLPPDVPRK